jgi:uncharacterized integral membrane protein (TIGR00698 family)
MQEKIYGIIFSVALGILIHFTAPYISFLNGIMLGFVVGILLGNFIKMPVIFQPGIGFTGSKLLEWSILFLAFGINVKHISSLGAGSFILVILLIVVVLGLTLLLARKFNCPTSAGWLVGFGTAICGSSAIAAVAPAIVKNKEDVGISMAVINLMGSIGMMILPLVFGVLAVNDLDSGLLIGATLHSVGNVAGAAYGMNELTGETAITIKLARVALLSPAVIAFTFMIKRSESGDWRRFLKLPYYLWGFILITIAGSLVQWPELVLNLAGELGKVVLTIAMVAIGLRVSFKTLYQSGGKAIGFGFVIFAIQLLVAIGLLFALKGI